MSKGSEAARHVGTWQGQKPSLLAKKKPIKVYLKIERWVDRFGRRKSKASYLKTLLFLRITFCYKSESCTSGLESINYREIKHGQKKG